MVSAGKPALRPLAKRLREARERILPKLTQDAVGRQLGVGGQAVSEWERGKGRPDQERLPAIAELYGVNLLWLMKGAGPMLSSDPAKEFMARAPETGAKLDELQQTGGDGMSHEIIEIYERLTGEGREELLTVARKLLVAELIQRPFAAGRRA